ncbi:uncharacterized protein LOC134220247 [Armigeres subalbatus]|uniref:uncharacterized protein LOC134220247 n=1 Tax=Armigeres subalbatus TaxID=124917 RepID=UPI002ED45C07
MSSNLTQTVLLTVKNITGMKNATASAGGVELPDNKHYPGNSESLNFLFIPLAVLITVMLLSVMVYLMARKKHTIFNKHVYVPSFSFDSSDLEDDNDLETEHLLKGKLRLDEPYFKGINSNKTYTGGNEMYA